MNQLARHPTHLQPTAGAASRVVGIGASAGGIEALQELFRNLPAHAGLSWIVVQHLSTEFKSVLDEPIARWTTLPVVIAADAQVLRADTVYVTAAGAVARVEGPVLSVQMAPAARLPRLPIDELFTSLAGWGDRAAGVILSGNGRDGTEGARTLHEAGGLVVAQQPESARFDGMPRAVIAAGVVHRVAAPARIGELLGQWCAHPTLMLASAGATGDADEADPAGVARHAATLEVLRRVFDVDFDAYKDSTLVRRLERWSELDGESVTPVVLAERLQHSTPLAERILADLLVGVTSFLRDPEAFEALRTLALEPAVAALAPTEELRLWCCGCSTGEEAYTLAILAREAFEAHGMAPRLRVHATDLHARSVHQASTGQFDDKALARVPEPWRTRYFVAQPSGLLRVAEEVRQCMVFSVHNVLRDAPFPRMHAVLCRNLLMYLKSQAQARVLGSFHVALRDGGMLLLGRSETPGQGADPAFETASDSAHLYRKRSGVRLPQHMRPLFAARGTAVATPPSPLDLRTSLRLHEVLAQRFVPRGFLVNRSDELVYLFGDAGRFLDPAAGGFGTTLQRLLGGALRAAVTLALRRAAHSDATVVIGDLVPNPERPDEPMRVEVDRIADARLSQVHFLVRLVPQPPESDVQADVLRLEPASWAAQHVAELESELLRTRELLEHTVEELESTNEGLQTGNEELQTANEELHALNEELYSVNAEHELKITELREATDDLNNLLRSAEVAIIFLDSQRQIRLFTPPATQVFPLRGVDIGRDLHELVPHEVDATLFADIDHVRTSGETVVAELRFADGRTLRRRISPYHAAGKRSDGLVLTYLDVTEQLRVQAQALELRSKARVGAIVSSVPHLMWIADASGSFDFLGAQWRVYTGAEEARLLGCGWREHLHPDDRDAAAAAWSDAVHRGALLRMRFRIRRHDGQFRWFDTQAVPTRGQDGRIEAWYGSCTDFHDTVELQTALEERESFTQMLADNVGGLLAYWDHELRNRFANRSYLHWFGLTQHQMRGLSMPDVIGGPLFGRVRPHVEAALGGQEQTFEETVKRPDGSLGRLLVRYWPHTVDDRVLGFLSTATDVTTLREQQLLIEEAFRATPLASLVVDDGGRIAQANPAAGLLVGLDPAGLVGRVIEDLLPAELRERHGGLRRAFNARSDRRPMGGAPRFPLLRADGSVVPVSIELAGVSVDGRPGTVAFLRPVDALDITAPRGEAAERARNAFLAQMSHEIRTPLNAIMGMVQLLALESPTPRQLDRLQRVEEASTHLLAIIDDILDLSKMEAGRIALDVAPFDVAGLLDRAVPLVDARARPKHLETGIEVAPQVPQLLVGDARRIEQIVVNFLTNAVKYTPAGTIRMRASCLSTAGQRTVLHVEVSDTGIGIDAAQLDQLFTPFHQVDQGHSRRFGGVGLGLAISRQLARAMDGDCGVRSTPGVGSTFWFNLQLERAGPTAMPGSVSPLAGDAADSGDLRALCRGRRLLLVEDDSVNRIVAFELIRSLTGLEADTAADGEEAVEMASRRHYDLVLMDIQLPAMDGLEATRRMRALAGRADMPVVALTANVLAEDVNASLAAGMEGHLGKPILARELTSLLQTLWSGTDPRRATGTTHLDGHDGTDAAQAPDGPADRPVPP